MASEADFVTVGQPHTQEGKMIVWQVSLYRITEHSTWMSDWRDVSMVHSCVMEAAYQAQLRHATLPAPDFLQGELPAAEDGGDWIVDLQDWVQVNSQTQTRRKIRRCVITGSRT
jgi:hypothetical protein